MESFTHQHTLIAFRICNFFDWLDWKCF